ncbi:MULTISPECIES: hypothetical protein [Ensifer]|uniref:hypothetical protein n=1 Tax=Ensifer TaxID=106591 RepID=UPI000DC4CDA6|nr:MULTISPECIES: hypothetical protein [Ensifer]MBD9625745.1 hypothetical protein [Ensifer sp. ENS06]RAS11471.1 hypothetical protein DEU52_1102 [Ensifer adhaerens]
MTTISPTSNVALEILRRTTAEAEEKAGSADSANNILKAANGVSAEPGRATTQAQGAVNNSILELKARADAFVGTALELLNSDRFKSSDPNVKAVLKEILNEQGEIFAGRVEAELLNNPGLRHEAAIANALTATVRGNRSRFAETEIVLGYKLKTAGDQLHYVADAEGHSSGQFLADAQNEARIGLDIAQKARANAKGDAALAAALKAEEEAERIYRRTQQSVSDWNGYWTKKFGWPEAR